MINNDCSTGVENSSSEEIGRKGLTVQPSVSDNVVESLCVRIREM